MSGTEQERGRKELVDGLSRRFVELRKKAELTQQGVADAMGKSRARRMPAGRLERGGAENASLLTVAEYLRAVRAGFGDLKDVLGRYTSLPIPEPARRLAEAAPLPRAVTGSRAPVCLPGGDEKREPGSRTPSPDQELEVLRVRRKAGYWVLRRVFEHFLHSELTAMGIPPTSWFRRRTAQYARKVFNALYRTRGRKEAKRQERLARLRAWAEKQHLVAPIPEYMELAVGLVFEDMAAHDELDWMPPPEEAFAIMSVKPKHRVVTDAMMCLAEWNEAYARFSRAYQETYARAHEAALRLTAELRCDARTAFRYKMAAMFVSNIGANTAPGTKLRNWNTAEFNAKQWPPEVDRRLVARMLAVALEVWDSSRPTLPPSPGPMPV